MRPTSRSRSASVTVGPAVGRARGGSAGAVVMCNNETRVVASVQVEVLVATDVAILEAALEQFALTGDPAHERRRRRPPRRGEPGDASTGASAAGSSCSPRRTCTKPAGCSSSSPLAFRTCPTRPDSRLRPGRERRHDVHRGGRPDARARPAAADARGRPRPDRAQHDRRAPPTCSGSRPTRIAHRVRELHRWRGTEPPADPSDLGHTVARLIHSLVRRPPAADPTWAHPRPPDGTPRRWSCRSCSGTQIHNPGCDLVLVVCGRVRQPPIPVRRAPAPRGGRSCHVASAGKPRTTLSPVRIATWNVNSAPLPDRPGRGVPAAPRHRRARAAGDQGPRGPVAADGPAVARLRGRGGRLQPVERRRHGLPRGARGRAGRLRGHADVRRAAGARRPARSARPAAAYGCGRCTSPTAASVERPALRLQARVARAAARRRRAPGSTSPIGARRRLEHRAAGRGRLRHGGVREVAPT